MGAGAQRKYATATDESEQPGIRATKSEPTGRMQADAPAATPSSGSSTKPRLGFKGRKLRVQTLPVSAVAAAAAAAATDGLRHIRWTKSFRSEYTMGDEVMPSTNYGTTVYYATRISDGAKLVIKHRIKAKCFNIGAETEENHKDWRMSTEYLLNLPRSDRIAELYEVLEDSEAYYVVMEKVDGLDLFEALGSPDRPDRAEIQQILKQLLEGVASLHARGYIHRDIKLENVMCQSPKSTKSGRRKQNEIWSTPKVANSEPSAATSGPDGKPQFFADEAQEVPYCSEGTHESPVPVVKIIDFDTVEDYSPRIHKVAKVVLGTDMYIAQEAYSGRYSPASDIYSIGVIAYKLITGKFPFADAVFKQGDNTVGSASMIQTQENVRQAQVDWARPPLNTDTQAMELIRSMMSPIDTERPTAEEAQKHPWFSTIFEQDAQ